MHPIFSVTLFTGQQLVLEAIQRWLQRPCADAEAHRQRRLGLKGLVTLLLRTAATGVLATLLDAAIEFRRRQLLAAAAAEPGDVAAAAAAGGGGSRFPGLGMVSRAGVAAWKGRLLLCIDELERRAEAYGIGAPLLLRLACMRMSVSGDCCALSAPRPFAARQFPPDLAPTFLCLACSPPCRGAAPL